MKKKQKTVIMLAVITAFVALVVCLPSHIGAGDLEPTDPPGSTMHTLEDIYDIVSANSDKIDQIHTLFPF